jgi:hypothetical protein
MLASRELNGRKLSPTHIKVKMQAKLISKASSSTAYIFRREFRALDISPRLVGSAGGIIGEVRIRPTPSVAAQ